MSAPPDTILGVITFLDGAGIFGIAYRGRTFEAADPLGLDPALGDTVVAEYLQSAAQFIIVGVL